MIQHIDIDSFYISVEELYNPEIKSLPAVTRHPHGPITSANYKAKALGIDSATRIRDALEIEPELRMIDEHPIRYETFSELFFNFAKRHNREIMIYSRDEIFIKWSDDREEAKEKAIETLEDLRKKLKLGISSCLAPHIFLAKMGTSMAKPNGFLYLPEEKDIERFYDWPVEKFHGIGPKIGQRLRGHGLKTIGDIARTSQKILTVVLGPAKGNEVFFHSRGKDFTQFIPWYKEIPDKTIGNTLGPYQVDPDYKKSYFRDFEQMLRGYYDLSSRVEARMKKGKYYGRTVIVGVRLQEDQHWVSRSKSVTPYFNNKEVMRSVTEKDLLPFLPLQERIDRIGLRVINLVRGWEWKKLI